MLSPNLFLFLILIIESRSQDQLIQYSEPVKSIEIGSYSYQEVSPVPVASPVTPYREQIVASPIPVSPQPMVVPPIPVGPYYQYPVDQNFQGNAQPEKLNPTQQISVGPYYQYPTDQNIQGNHVIVGQPEKMTVIIINDDKLKFPEHTYRRVGDVETRRHYKCEGYRFCMVEQHCWSYFCPEGIPECVSGLCACNESFRPYELKQCLISANGRLKYSHPNMMMANQQSMNIEVPENKRSEPLK